MARGIAGLLSLALMFSAGTDAAPQNMPEEGGAAELTDAERAEDAVVAAMLAPWTGDLYGMVARGRRRRR